MKQRCLLTVLVLLITPLLRAQSTPYQLKPILEKELQSPSVVDFQLQEYLMKQVPKLPPITTPEKWTSEGEQIRKRVLDNVVFHGWPSEWVNSPPRFEDLGTIPSGKGYRLRKLRYEVVPGFYSTALLYEPENLQGKAPAVLNVMGHHGAIGKAEEFQQKMCINEALRGMMALNLEWLGMGELFDKQNAHWFGGQLDLVGANDGGVVLSGHAPRARLFVAKPECGSKAHRGDGIVRRRLANHYFEFARRKGERVHSRGGIHVAGRKVSARPGPRGRGH